MYIVLTLFDLLLVISDVDFGKLTHWGTSKMAAILQMSFFKFISLRENCCIFISISLKFACEDLINNNMAMVG